VAGTYKFCGRTVLPLCDMKEANPIKVAEYTVANKIEHNPAFAWCVPCTLKKRDCFVAMAKACKVKVLNLVLKFRQPWSAPSQLIGKAT
jgi:hypothetical protein